MRIALHEAAIIVLQEQPCHKQSLFVPRRSNWCIQTLECMPKRGQHHSLATCRFANKDWSYTKYLYRKISRSSMMDHVCRNGFCSCQVILCQETIIAFITAANQGDDQMQILGWKTDFGCFQSMAVSVSQSGQLCCDFQMRHRIFSSLD